MSVCADFAACPMLILFANSLNCILPGVSKSKPDKYPRPTSISGISFCMCTYIEDGSLRLLTVAANKGTLEIYHLSSWGSICDDGFTDESATVACKELGLG